MKFRLRVKTGGVGGDDGESRHGWLRFFDGVEDLIHSRKTHASFLWIRREGTQHLYATTIRQADHPVTRGKWSVTRSRERREGTDITTHRGLSAPRQLYSVRSTAPISAGSRRLKNHRSHGANATLHRTVFFAQADDTWSSDRGGQSCGQWRQCGGDDMLGNHA